ncbi:MAG TPA: hypothetical protein VJZ72_06820 [Candidatus Limnocylindrales bacterium]|nr:hypothetical protein [Candidatus Limnocylindrales bacterium]
MTKRVGPTATPATKVWKPGAQLLWGNPALDDLRKAGLRIVVASQALASGQSAEQWVSSYVDKAPKCSSGLELPAPVAVGGHSATITLNGCPPEGGGVEPGSRIYDVVLVVDGRGYAFTIAGLVDPAYVQAILDTVTFDAASAVDVVPSASP